MTALTPGNVLGALAIFLLLFIGVTVL